MKTGNDRLRMMSVGDVLIHMEIVKAARGDFSMLFGNMQETFRQADLVTANQETVLTDRVPPRGFPVFATPTAVGKAEAGAGISLVSCASNHSLDRWDRGMADSLAFWKKHPETAAVGIREKGKLFSPAVIERNGIRLAFLAYTAPMNFHFNLPLSRYAVERLHPLRKRKIKEEIAVAKKSADAVVVMPHWGMEYLYAPTAAQRKWGQFIADAGADLIIGTHPHVLQPLETVTASDGRAVPVFWSLGNFISAQKRPGTMLGGLADCLWERTEECVRLIRAELKPLAAATDEKGSFFTTYPLEAYPDELSARNFLFRIIEEEHGVRTDKAYLEKLFAEILSGKAQRDNPFQTLGDVRRYNAGRILKLLRGK